MKPHEPGSASPLALSLARNERLFAELREIASRSSLATNTTNPPLRDVPLAQTPFEIDGQEHPASLFSLSLGEGRLATDHKPSVGSLIRIGRITARVVGHLQDGVAIEFLNIDD